MKGGPLEVEEDGELNNGTALQYSIQNRGSTPSGCYPLGKLREGQHEGGILEDDEDGELKHDTTLQ